jgi:hypothetical protein
MNQDFKKVFKTPKYTGVSLALLSMFVLTCMMVVWNRISETPKGTNSEVLEIFCENRLQSVFRPAIQSFYQNTGIGSNVSFLTKDELQSAISEGDYQHSMIFIGKKSLSSKENFQNNFNEKFLIGHNAVKDEKLPQEEIFCLMGNQLTQPSYAFALTRFILSPDHGHVLLKPKGFIPQPGDKWQRTPSVIVFATESFREELSHCLKNFSIKEGIQVELNIKTAGSISKTIALIAKSNAKQYLPDIVFGCNEIEEYPELFMPRRNKILSTFAQESYISKASKSWYAAQRLVTAVEKSFAK